MYKILYTWNYRVRLILASTTGYVYNVPFNEFNEFIYYKITSLFSVAATIFCSCQLIIWEYLLLIIVGLGLGHQ